jgi:hypothetical protein
MNQVKFILKKKKTSFLYKKPSVRSEVNLHLQQRGCVNMLPSLSYYAPQGTVINDCVGRVVGDQQG